MLLNKKQIAAILAAAAGVLWIYQKRNAILSVLTVFAYAAGFLVLLSPVCTVLEKRGFGSSVSAIASISMVLSAVVLLFSLLLPYLIVNTTTLLKKILPVATDIARNVLAFLNQSDYYQIQPQGLHQMLANLIPSLSAHAARGGITVASQSGKWIFSVILAYYLLRERKTVGYYLLLCFPVSSRIPALQAARGCRNALLGYLSGTIKTSVFVAAVMYVGLLLLDIENAFFLAVLMGLFEILPYVGPFLGAAPVVLSALSNGMQTAGMAILLVLLVQQIENSFAGPYFTATSTSIHPLAAIVSVFVFGSIGGVWGILLAIPVLVSVRSVLWSIQKYRR